MAAAHFHSPRWDAETLWQDLTPVLPGIRVEVLPEVDSTNTRLLQRSADSAPCLLVAEHQNQGRGRMGRQWLSAAGASLTFSLGLPLAPVRWEGLSLAIGLALAQALEPLLPGLTPQLMLKWPNDLWLVNRNHTSSGRKLGGVLVETTTVAPWVFNAPDSLGQELASGSARGPRAPAGALPRKSAA